MRIHTVAIVALSVLSASFCLADTLPFPPQAKTNSQTEVCTFLSRSYLSDACFVQSHQGASSTTSHAGQYSTSKASVNLNTGILRASAKGTSRDAAEGVGYEFLSFDTGANPSATVSYSFSVDGTLQNTSQTGAASAAVYFGLFDVTGLSTYFWTQQLNLTGPTIISGVTPAVAAGMVSSNDDNFLAYGNQYPDLMYYPIAPDFHLYASEDGSIIPVSDVLTGSFTVLPGHLYLAQLQIDADLYGFVSDPSYQAVDFSHTAAFNFTNLDGATYVSSSGSFLSAASTPEPSSFALMVSGTLSLAALARRKAKR